MECRVSKRCRPVRCSELRLIAEQGCFPARVDPCLMPCVGQRVIEGARPEAFPPCSPTQVRLDDSLDCPLLSHWLAVERKLVLWFTVRGLVVLKPLVQHINLGCWHVAQGGVFSLALTPPNMIRTKMVMASGKHIKCETHVSTKTTAERC